MLFDFQSFIRELRDNQEKKEIIEKYEKYLGPIEGDLKDQPWYQNFISKFPTVYYNIPDELKDDFDWDLLMQLVAGSFSSDGVVDNEGGNDSENESSSNLPEFVISVYSGDQSVVKKVSELWGFQILRLFEIYVEEQLNLEALIHEDEKEKEAIESQRESRLERWKLVMDNLDTEQKRKEEEKEKEEKLNDLYGQL